MRGPRATAMYTRLLRVLVTLVTQMPPPPCSCERPRRGLIAHAVMCHRWLHLRILAQITACGLTPYAGAHAGRVLDALEEGRGTAGGADAHWRGGGMDPVVRDWLGREIERARERAANARSYSDDTRAHDARVRALRHVRTALRRYAEAGTQILDATEAPCSD